MNNRRGRGDCHGLNDLIVTQRVLMRERCKYLTPTGFALRYTDSLIGQLSVSFLPSVYRRFDLSFSGEHPVCIFPTPRYRKTLDNTAGVETVSSNLHSLALGEELKKGIVNHFSLEPLELVSC